MPQWGICLPVLPRPSSLAQVHECQVLACGPTASTRVAALRHAIVAQHCLAPLYACGGYPLAVSASHALQALSDVWGSLGLAECLGAALRDRVCAAVVTVSCSSLGAALQPPLAEKLHSVFAPVFSQVCAVVGPWGVSICVGQCAAGGAYAAYRCLWGKHATSVHRVGSDQELGRTDQGGS